MAYTTSPYCSLAQVVSALDLSTTAQEADQNWIITDLIPQAQSAIDSYLGFSFQTDGTLASPSSRLLSGRDTDRLFILERCISFSQVLEDTLDITPDCVLKPDNTIPGLYLKRKSGDIFALGEQNYTITGIFGRPSIPANITRACIRICVSWYKMRDTNYSDYIIEGMVRQHYQRDLPDDVKEILDQYRLRAFRA